MNNKAEMDHYAPSATECSPCDELNPLLTEVSVAEAIVL
jgi:thiol-disulfide isomerase/thioredoxin